MAYTGAGYINACKKYLGTPYSKLNCSQFTRAAMKDYTGKDIGRNCRVQLSNFRNKAPSMVAEIGGGTVPPSKVKAGDLIYKMNYSGSADHVMVSDGAGGVYESSNGAGMVRHKTGYSWAYKDVTAIVRVFSNTGRVDIKDPAPSQTGGKSGGGSSIGGSTSEGSAGGTSGGKVQTVKNPDYSYLLSGGLDLTNIDTYKSVMESKLADIRKTSTVVDVGSTLSMEGSSIGYIIDLTTNQQMKFILPEFSDNTSAVYENIVIPGRSAEIPSYNYTNGRGIPIRLELMAGAGLYTGSDPVVAMHKDIAFLQSLVYPDYSSSIVKPPSIVLVSLGPSTAIKGIATDVNVDYKKPYTTTGIPMRAEVTITVKQATDYPADMFDVRKKNSTSY